jgi:hypothetical protein
MSENTGESEPVINQHPVMNNSDIGNSKVNMAQNENCSENNLAIRDGSVNLLSAMKGARFRAVSIVAVSEVSDRCEADESSSEEEHPGKYSA